MLGLDVWQRAGCETARFARGNRSRGGDFGETTSGSCEPKGGSGTSREPLANSCNCSFVQTAASVTPEHECFDEDREENLASAAGEINRGCSWAAARSFSWILRSVVLPVGLPGTEVKSTDAGTICTSSFKEDSSRPRTLGSLPNFLFKRRVVTM